jgi:urease accessory protein
MPTETSTDQRADTAAVGRRGTLSLQYERRAGHTVLARSSSSSPWHCFPPTPLDDGRCAYTLLVNPSGGLVAGDGLSVDISVGANAHALISTPSANRIYRSTGATAEQTVAVRVGPDAVLEWLPDFTIPFADARYRQHVSVALEAGATLLYWDVLAAGRVACGERWAFAQVDSDLRITSSTGGALVERYRIEPQIDGLGLAADWNYVASVYLVGGRVTGETGAKLGQRLVSALESSAGVLSGVSETSLSGVAVKLLSKGATELREALEGVWGAARAELLCRSAPALRRY